MAVNHALVSALRDVDLGRSGSALRNAWLGVDEAIREGDEESLAFAHGLGQRLAADTQGGQRSEAERLVAYCDACLGGAGGGVRPTSLLYRMFRLGGRSEARQECPQCAESIAAGAKICRFCGHQISAPS